MNMPPKNRPALQTYFFALTWLILPTSALAKPASVVLIRHAEKPDIGAEVSQQGCERAYALPAFFQQDPVVNQFGKPVAYFAQRPKGDTSSLRPVQTLAPSASAAQLPVSAPVVRDDFLTLVQQLLSSPEFEGKTVVVAWEHNVIPQFAGALGLKDSSTPTGWPGSVYDQAWIITFLADRVALSIEPEHVLPGDNPKGNDDWKGPAGVDPHPPILTDSIKLSCTSNELLDALTLKTVIPRLSSLSGVP